MSQIEYADRQVEDLSSLYNPNRNVKRHFPKHQLAIVLRHGERADEHTETAMLNPALTTEGTKNIETQLYPQLKATLKAQYPSIDDSYLKNEFVVISSPFKRCIETATALIKAGVGAANALRVAGSVGPLIDDRICEVFGPIRIKKAIVAEFGGEDKLPEEFTHPDDRYFGHWCKQRGSKSYTLRGDKGNALPQYGESIDDAYYRYKQAMRQFAGEMEEVPGTAKNLIIVTHGDMLNALIGSLQPHRTIYAVEYLAFAVFERRLSRLPHFPQTFGPKDFKVIAENGIQSFEEGEAAPPVDWDEVDTDYPPQEPQLEVTSNVGSGASESLRTRTMPSDQRSVGTPAFSTPTVPPNPPTIKNATQNSNIYGSPDQHPPHATVPIPGYGSCDDETDPLCDASIDRRAHNLILPSQSFILLGYLWVAGLHLAGFGIASTALDSVAKSEAWAVGTAGSVVIMAFSLMHFVPQCARVEAAIENAIIGVLCGPLRVQSRSPSQTNEAGRQSTKLRTLKWNFIFHLCLRMFAFTATVVAVDTSAAYITSEKTNTDTLYLWDAITDNAGPWILFGASWLSWIGVEGRLAPWAHFRQAKADQRRVEPSVHA